MTIPASPPANSSISSSKLLVLGDFEIPKAFFIFILNYSFKLVFNVKPLIGEGGFSFSYLSNSALICSRSAGFSFSKNICKAGPMYKYNVPKSAIAEVRTAGLDDANAFFALSINAFAFKLLQCIENILC